MKLTKAELASRGHAFDHGYEAQRAVRLFQEGIGHTPADDLALALGFPLLVELAPEVDGDLVELTKARINQPLRRLVPWPRNLAVRAARAIAFGWDQFPDVLCREANEAIARTEDFTPRETVQLMGTLTEVSSSSWDHTFELFFLLEALAGGEAVIAAVCDSVEANTTAWNTIDSSRRIVIMAIATMFDRLSAERAAAVRPRLEALLSLYKQVDPSGADRERTGMPLRALDLALNGAAGYMRSSRDSEWGRDRSDAHFLDRAGFAELAVPRAAPLPYMLPSVQWVVQGDVGELRNVGDWSKYEFKGSKLEAHRWVVDQFARLRAIEATLLLAAIASEKKSNPLVVEATKRHLAGLRPNFERISKDAKVAPALRNAAADVLSKAIPS